MVLKQILQIGARRATLRRDAEVQRAIAPLHGQATGGAGAEETGGAVDVGTSAAGREAGRSRRAGADGARARIAMGMGMGMGLGFVLMLRA